MSRTKSKKINLEERYQPGVDIVMPCHGELEFLRLSIPPLKIAAEKVEAKFFIGDTQSDREKECKKYLQEEGFNLWHTRVNGYLQGCNFLAAKGHAEYILITTPDVILEPDAIVMMKQTLDAYTAAGIAAPLLLFQEGSDRGKAGTVQHAGMESDINGNMIHIFMGWERNHPKVQRERKCLTCTGATFLVRRSLWEQFKGFDPRYGLGTYEDQDLCLSVNKSGFYVHYQPQAVGHHFVGASSLYAKEGKYEFPLQKNRILFAQKWAKAPWTDWEIW